MFPFILSGLVYAKIPGKTPGDQFSSFVFLASTRRRIPSSSMERFTCSIFWSWRVIPENRPAIFIAMGHRVNKAPPDEKETFRNVFCIEVEIFSNKRAGQRPDPCCYKSVLSVNPGRTKVAASCAGLKSRYWSSGYYCGTQRLHPSLRHSKASQDNQNSTIHHAECR